MFYRKILSAAIFVLIFAMMDIAAESGHMMETTYTGISEDPLPPLFPLILYGNVTIDGEPAPDGTELTAVMDGEEKGHAMVMDGMYGEPFYNRLLVNGHPGDENKVIRFYTGTMEAVETIKWDSGKFTRLDLSFFESEPISSAEVILEDEDRTRTRNRVAGTSGENPANILLSEVSRQYVYQNQLAHFEFSGEGNAIFYIEFMGMENIGIVPIRVEMINKKCELAPSQPPGNLYHFIGITLGNGANGFAFDNPHIGFRIDKNWITSKNIDPDTIILYRSEGDRWTPTHTMQIDEDNQYLYFDSAIPGFSLFAITAEKVKPISEAKAGGEGMDMIPLEKEDTGFKGIPGFSLILSLCSLMILILIRRYR